MLLPNKIVSYNESVISKFPVVLKTINQNKLPPKELYSQTKNSFAGIQDFIHTLDALFALKKIELLNENNKEVLKCL